MNFKISKDNNEYFISARRRFASVLTLLNSYKSAPIRSKKTGSDKIFLLYPIPVDPVLEEKHKQLLEDKGQGSCRGQSLMWYISNVW